jgi:hypothetical protein
VFISRHSAITMLGAKRQIFFQKFMVSHQMNDESLFYEIHIIHILNQSFPVQELILFLRVRDSHTSGYKEFYLLQLIE